MLGIKYGFLPRLALIRSKVCKNMVLGSVLKREALHLPVFSEEAPRAAAATTMPSCSDLIARRSARSMDLVLYPLLEKVLRPPPR
jgi:hypothetical protein